MAQENLFAYQLAATSAPWYAGMPRPDWATGSYHMAEDD